MRKWLKWILIGVSATLVLCIVVVLAFGGGEETERAEAVPTETLQATASEDPATTVIPEPTMTATPTIHTVKSGETISVIAAQHGVTVDAIVEANKNSEEWKDKDTVEVGQKLVIPASKQTSIQRSPEPSDISQPTTVPIETLSRTEYLDRLEPIQMDQITAIVVIGDLFEEAPPSAVLVEDWWCEDMAEALLLLVDCNDRLRELDPPVEYQESHEYLLNAADHFDLFVEYMAEAMDNADPGQGEKAFEHWDAALESTQKANDALPIDVSP